MSDARSPRDAGSDPTRSGRRLESWKAIADYLGRHVTTVQRWEHEEGLPVHRHQHEKRGSIYAYPAELDEWLIGRSSTLGPDGSNSADSGPVSGQDTTGVRQPDPTTAEASRASTAAVQAQTVHARTTTGRARRHDVSANLLPRRWSHQVWAAVAAVAVGLTIAAGLAKDLWPSRNGEQVLSIAVLPLKNSSPDQQGDYFVDGMTEALTTDLASLQTVRVIARQSVMQYRGTSKPASVIAKELGVAALVEGAVQQVGGRVRVDIRLIDGATSRSVWASTYERDLSDALALQADISRAIAGELHLTLDPSLNEQIRNRRPSRPEAWDAYLRARFHWNRRTHDDMSRAIEWYERAIELDPSSPLIFAGLADVYATLGPPNTPVSELITRGTAAAMRAIELDPTMGEPFAALGKLRAYDWDWTGAERNYRRAIELAPGYAPARYWFGSFLANQRRCDEAFAQASVAEQLDPVSLPGNMVVAGIELKCNRIEHAIRRTETILAFDPNFGQAYESLGRSYLMKGDTNHAITMFRRALVLTGGRPTIQAVLAYAYAGAGQRQEAEVIARELAVLHGRDKTNASAWSVAVAHAGLGQDEAALSWLEHAYDDREEWLEGLAADERFRELHSRDRFQQLLLRLGLPSAPPSATTER